MSRTSTRRDFALAAAGGLVGSIATGFWRHEIRTPIADPATTDTFRTIRNTGRLHVAGIRGAEPYYHKDALSGEWSGFCIAMARDLAHSLGAEIDVLETTWGNAVLDLEAEKVDIVFGLSATPKRALAIDFTASIMDNMFTVIVRDGLAIDAWKDLDRPDIRIAVDRGSTHDLFVRRMLPHATLVGMETLDESVLALQAGRADCVVQVAMLAVVTLHKNPALGRLVTPSPPMSQPTCAGIRPDPLGRFRGFCDDWIRYNRALGSIQAWVLESLKLVGVKTAELPPSVRF